jgi:hypothetical protein
VEAAEIVRSDDAMTLASHFREGKVEVVHLNGGPLNGSTTVRLKFFDDKLYDVFVLVDPDEISPKQLAKLAERKYGPSLLTESTGLFKYQKRWDKFFVTVVGMGRSVGINFIDETMQKACEKYKLDQIGSL